MTERVGFIGLGIMGLPMAGNILKAGFPVTVWNRTASRAEPLAQAGAQVAASPREVAAQSDIIITMVTASEDVRQVTLGEDGVIHGAQRGAVVVDMSTISPQVTREIAEALQAQGIAMLDAPVSGGDVGARNATLSIMVGGDAAVVERVRPVFEAMGKKITHIGPNGAGQTCKLVNQILVVGNNMAMAEALTFATRAGVDVGRVLEAVSGGAAGSWQLSNLGPRILKRDFAPGFSIRNQQKDLRLAMEAADQMRLPLLGTSMIHSLFRVLEADGRADEGTQALVKALEKLTGVTVEG
ncbi:MAG: NAD(P)-dependent oxidoreductase [Anaerolineae bacterium]|nr:NAD(P)-dependent oxidoreductase [Anaerolineae bacterium]